MGLCPNSAAQRKMVGANAPYGNLHCCLGGPSSHCGHRARSPPSPSAGLFADEVVAQLAGACWMVCCIQSGHIIKAVWVWIWHNHAGIMLHSASGERAMQGPSNAHFLCMPRTIVICRSIGVQVLVDGIEAPCSHRPCIQLFWPL